MQLYSSAGGEPEAATEHLPATTSKVTADMCNTASAGFSFLRCGFRALGSLQIKVTGAFPCIQDSSHGPPLEPVHAGAMTSTTIACFLVPCWDLGVGERIWAATCLDSGNNHPTPEPEGL
ncbi:uncharacterized protein LOC124775574 [Schistocerca piceifrons]|uniref:uncharacterized protein LOC124775574 n=1 Tax=Schistocerca piceifrons TaxID=274613 RepID=UPI001F5F9178|nr:uncharacterized protein LOC124775574 [Schistocerca piceifrons]